MIALTMFFKFENVRICDNCCQSTEGKGRAKSGDITINCRCRLNNATYYKSEGLFNQMITRDFILPENCHFHLEHFLQDEI